MALLRTMQNTLPSLRSQMHKDVTADAAAGFAKLPLNTFPCCYQPYVPEQGLDIGSKGYPPHHQGTCFPTFSISVSLKYCLLKLIHFSTASRQHHRNFYSWLFIQDQLCLILYATWSDRSILSQLLGIICLQFCWIPVLVRSARYHLAAVPGLALLAPRWHAVSYQKQN